MLINLVLVARQYLRRWTIEVAFTHLLQENANTLRPLDLMLLSMLPSTYCQKHHLSENLDDLKLLIIMDQNRSN